MLCSPGPMKAEIIMQVSADASSVYITRARVVSEELVISSLSGMSFCHAFFMEKHGTSINGDRCCGKDL